MAILGYCPDPSRETLDGGIGLCRPEVEIEKLDPGSDIINCDQEAVAACCAVVISDANFDVENAIFQIDVAAINGSGTVPFGDFARFQGAISPVDGCSVGIDYAGIRESNGDVKIS